MSVDTNGPLGFMLEVGQWLAKVVVGFIVIIGALRLYTWLWP